MTEKEIQEVTPEELRGVLITKTAIKTLVPESIVEVIISEQFKGVRDAMRIHSQVEISGFGKFLISPNKVVKRMVMLERAIQKLDRALEENPDMPKGRRDHHKKRKKEMEEVLEYLKTRKSGYEN